MICPYRIHPRIHRPLRVCREVQTIQTKTLVVLADILPENPSSEVIRALSEQLARAEQVQTVPIDSQLPADFVARCVTGSLEEKEDLFKYLREINWKTTVPEVTTVVRNVQLAMSVQNPTFLNPALPEPCAAI
jgi:hypothetical protein